MERERKLNDGDHSRSFEMQAITKGYDFYKSTMDVRLNETTHTYTYLYKYKGYLNVESVSGLVNKCQQNTFDESRVSHRIARNIKRGFWNCGYEWIDSNQREWEIQEEIINHWDSIRQEGKDMHIVIENYLLEGTEPIDAKQCRILENFKIFQEEYLLKYPPLFSHLKLFDTYLMLGGTVSIVVAKNKTGDVILGDWKHTSFRNDAAQRYVNMKMNIYRNLVQHLFGWRVVEMFVVIFDDFRQLNNRPRQLNIPIDVGIDEFMNKMRDAGRKQQEIGSRITSSFYNKFIAEFMN